MRCFKHLSVLAAVLTASTAVGCSSGTGNEAASAEYRAAIVERGDLRETVSVTGPVDVRERIELTFLQAGAVEEIYVQVGDRVAAGAPIMSLDTTAMELQLVDAQLTVDLQQLAYNEIVAGPSQFDLAATQAVVAQAQARLDQISEPPSEEVVRLAQENLNLARLELWRLQALRDQLRLQNGEGHIVQSADQQVNWAELAVLIAEQQLISAQEGASSYDIAIARASVVQTQATLNRLLVGSSDTDLELARLQILQAQLALEQVMLSLDDTRLVAPFDGIVADINYDLGENVTPGTPAAIVLDDSSYHIDLLVDEIDIVRVQIGQLAFVTLDAFPDARLSGHVVRMAPDGTSAAGVLSYEVRVQIDSSDIPLRDSLTATVDIVVAELTNVLLVPNWAVRFDRRTGAAYVNVRRDDGTIEEIEIEVGVRGEALSEVRAGLAEGDEVVVSLVREDFSFLDDSGE